MSYRDPLDDLIRNAPLVGALREPEVLQELAQWGHEGLLASVTAVIIVPTLSASCALIVDTGFPGVPSPDRRNPPCRAPPLA